jgi:hypothetical protein
MIAVAIRGWTDDPGKVDLFLADLRGISGAFKDTTGGAINIATPLRIKSQRRRRDRADQDWPIVNE